MWKEEKKDRVQTSIVIVASCDGYSLDGFKIAMQRSVGLLDTTMREIGGSRGGMNSIPAQYLKEMFETSGRRAIEVNTGTGDD